MSQYMEFSDACQAMPDLQDVCRMWPPMQRRAWPRGVLQAPRCWRWRRRAGGSCGGHRPMCPSFVETAMLAFHISHLAASNVISCCHVVLLVFIGIQGLSVPTRCGLARSACQNDCRPQAMGYVHTFREDVPYAVHAITSKTELNYPSHIELR